MYVWSAPTRAEASSRTTQRFSVFAGAAILAAIALSTATSSLNVDLASPPSALEAGEAWVADVNVKRAGLPVDGAKPLVAVTDDSGITHFFAASPGARPGTYRVKIVLPEGGSWSYEVRVGEKVYERGVVRAQQPSLPEGI
jgi:hypothetical protein